MMQFYLHGNIEFSVSEALKSGGHTTHVAADLAERARISPDKAEPRELFKALATCQWMLLTDDRELVQCVYDHRIACSLVIVLLINTASTTEQAKAITRLFERYPRLTPGRLYAITPGRVKIRQLPQPAGQP